MAKSRQEEIVLARMIDMQNRLEKFDDEVLRSLKKEYTVASRRLLDDVTKAKSKSGRIWTNTRLTALLEETQISQQAIVGLLTGRTAEEMVKVGAYSYSTMNNIVGWDGRVLGYNNVSLSPQQLYNMVTTQKLSGKTLEEWVGTALSADVDSIKREVSQGLIRGEGYSKMLSRLKEEVSLTKGGSKERDLETVVKTYTQAINGKAQQDVYNANDIVNRLEWSAIMERGNVATGRGTCPRCIALDGQVWNKDDLDRPPMPLHPRCRCMFIPVTKTWRELGFDIDEMEKAYQPWTVRDDAGKIVEHGFEKDYAEWFKTRDKTFQDRAIGPTRAQLYRDGKIKLEDLVDSKGNLLTLDELARGATKTRKVIPPIVVPSGQSVTPARTRTDSAAVPEVVLPDEVFDDYNPRREEAFKTELNKLHPDLKRVVSSLPPPDKIKVEGNKGVYNRREKSITANPFERSGMSIRHEYGHYVDHAMNSKRTGRVNDLFMLTEKDRTINAGLARDKKLLLNGGGNFRDEISHLNLARIDDLLRGPKGTMYTETAGIQDTIDGITKGDFREVFGAHGHSKTYWSRDPDYAAIEAFANMFEMYNNEKVWTLAEEILPNTTKAFKDVIEKYLKDNKL